MCPLCEQPSGTTGIDAAIEAVEIKLEGKTKGHHVRYQGHVQSIGWMGWVQDGETSGSTGRHLRLEALRLEIVKGDQPTAPGVDGLTIQYETHSASAGWTGVFENGEVSGTTGQALQIEALKIKILDPKNRMGVRYQARLRGEVWTQFAENGTMLGTVGQDIALDAFKVWLVDPPKGVTVRYQGHVEGRGWMDWVAEGEMAGTERQGLRLEAIRIELVKN